MQDRRTVVAEIHRLLDEQTLALQVDLRGEEAERYVERSDRIAMLMELLSHDNPPLTLVPK